MLIQQDKTTQGLIGTKIAELYYMILGYCVNLPAVDFYPYDFLVDYRDNRTIKKVQVKTTRYRDDEKNGKFIVNLDGLDRTKFDYLFVVTQIGDCYEIPSEKVGGTYKIVLGPKYDSYLVWNPMRDFGDLKAKHLTTVDKLFIKENIL